MKGINPDADNATSRPRSSKRMIVGIMYHFLLWRRKYQYSFSSPGGACSASRANCLPVSAGLALLCSVIMVHALVLSEVSVNVPDRLSPYPVRLLLSFKSASHRIVSEQSHQQADGCHPSVIYERQQSVRDAPADRVHHSHPQHVRWPLYRRRTVIHCSQE